MTERKRPGPKPQHGAKIEVRLPEDMKRRAIERAEAAGERLSDRVRRLIAEWLERPGRP